MAKILLVEDDQLLREINTDILSSEGFEVVSAVDGEDAFEKIRTSQWDLILMDVVIPKMNGFEVIDKVKDELKMQLLAPLIFLTNMDDEKDKSRAESLGGTYVIKGNLTPPDLVELVRKSIAPKV